MKNKANLKYLAVFLTLIACGLFGYLFHSSKMLSYFSNDPKACINCHVMNTQYATWQHSSHARNATCLDCHAKPGNVIQTYIAKAMDGYNHGVAITLDSYPDIIKISKGGEKRVQQNCTNCHSTLISQTSLGDENHNGKEAKMCWECHRDVAHGTIKGFMVTPNALGVKDVLK